MKKVRIFQIAMLVVVGALVLVNFQNCQKKTIQEVEDSSYGTNTGEPFPDDDGSDDGNNTCPAGAQPAPCKPAGGGSLNIVGNLDRVFLASEGKPLHQVMGTTLPILAGWAFGKTKVSLNMNIYLNGEFCRSVLANISRGDLKTHWAYPGDPPNYGWGLIIDGLPPGNYMAVAKAVDPNTCEEVNTNNNGYTFTVE